jgi:protein-S-isoprenylcysteine O-methyltransferase Ste14
LITIAALVLCLTWLGVAFGLGSIIQRRRTGDARWPSPGGRPTSIQWWTRIVVGIGAVAAGLAAPLADLIGLSPIGALNQPWLRTIGLALAALATAASLAAQQAMGTAWRIGVDETKRTISVTNGPFRLVRSPFFSAVIDFATGLALAVPISSPWPGWPALPPQRRGCGSGRGEIRNEIRR